MADNDEDGPTTYPGLVYVTMGGESCWEWPAVSADVGAPLPNVSNAAEHTVPGQPSVEMHVTEDAPSSALAPLVETLCAELAAALRVIVPHVKPLVPMGGPELLGGVGLAQPLPALPGGLGCMGGVTLNTNSGNALPLGAVNPAGAYKPPSAYYPPMLPRPERAPTPHAGQPTPADYHALATEALALLLLSRRTYDVSDADIDAFEQRARAALMLPDEWRPTR